MSFTLTCLAGTRRKHCILSKYLGFINLVQLLLWKTIDLCFKNTYRKAMIGMRENQDLDWGHVFGQFMGYDEVWIGYKLEWCTCVLEEYLVLVYYSHNEGENSLRI